MIIPVRCFSCGKVVGEDYEEYLKRVQKGEEASEALDSMGIKRYCCRRMIFSHVDLLREIMQYKV